MIVGIVVSLTHRTFFYSRNKVFLGYKNLLRFFIGKENRKAQAWGFDLMLAAILFTAGIVVFYIYTLNYPTEGKEILDQLAYEGGLMTDNLLSEGFPPNWDSTNVVRIGIHDNKKVNETKLEKFYNLSIEPGGYQKTRSLFNTRYNYFFNFSEQMTLPIFGNVSGIGNQPSNPQNLIKITRFTIYKDKPVTLNLFIWE